MNKLIFFNSRKSSFIRILLLLLIVASISYLSIYSIIFDTFDKPAQIIIKNICDVKRPVSNDLVKNEVSLEVKTLFNLVNEFEQLNQTRIELGGEYVPMSTQIFLPGNNSVGKDCTIIDNSKYKIAIIIPFRNRSEHLRIFLNNMVPYLTRQRLHFKIFLIEPIKSINFNRGTLKNIGFVEAIKDSKKWNCFMFHDIDFMPEIANIIYECNDEYPVHFTVALKTVNYTTEGYFARYFGGVIAFTQEQFIKVNGYSNLFIAWGREDDDLYEKTIKVFSQVIKLPPTVGRYMMLSHDKEVPFKQRNRVFDDQARHSDPDKREGLNTLPDLYSVNSIEKHELFTRYLVSYVNDTNLETYMKNSFDIFRLLGIKRKKIFD